MRSAMELPADSILIERDGESVRAFVLESDGALSAAEPMLPAASHGSSLPPSEAEATPQGAARSIGDPELLRAAAAPSAVRYTLEQPHMRFACCTCASATQMRVCKHQLAVLLRLHPGPEAARTIVRMLGTRLGMQGGCVSDAAAPDALRPLRVALAGASAPQQSAVSETQLDTSTINGAGLGLPDDPQRPAPVLLAGVAGAESVERGPAGVAVTAVARGATREQRSEDEALKLAATLREQQEQLQALVSAQQSAAARVQLLKLVTKQHEHMLLRARSEAAVPAQTVPHLAVPAELSAKRRKDCIEVTQQRRKQAQAAPMQRLPPMALAPRKGKSGHTNVWRRNHNLVQVVGDLCGGEHSPAGKRKRRRVPVSPARASLQRTEEGARAPAPAASGSLVAAPCDATLLAGTALVAAARDATQPQDPLLYTGRQQLAPASGAPGSSAGRAQGSGGAPQDSQVARRPAARAPLGDCSNLSRD